MHAAAIRKGANSLDWFFSAAILPSKGLDSGKMCCAGLKGDRAR